MEKLVVVDEGGERRVHARLARVGRFRRRGDWLVQRCVARLDTYFYGDPIDANRDGLHPIGGPTSAAESGMGRKAIVIQTAVATVVEA